MWSKKGNDNGCKTDTNITVMSTVSLKNVKLSTGSCVVYIRDLIRL